MRNLLCLLLVQAAIFQTIKAQSAGTAQATAESSGTPTCDITDLNCIARDAKAAINKFHNKTAFEDEYQQFAEMIAPVLLLAHGGNFESADAALADFFTSIVNYIAGLGLVLTGQREPQISIAPPSLFNNGAANVSTQLAGVTGTAVGINYNPCVISVAPRGFDVTAAGVNIQPNVVEVIAEGLSIWPFGVNIQPALIYVNPWGANISPEGVSITPALIAVAPVIHSVGSAAVNVNPVGLAVKPGAPPTPGGRKMV